MAQHRSVALRLAIVLIALVAIAASSENDPKVAFKRDKVRSMRAAQIPPAAAAAPRQQQQQQQQRQQQQEAPQYEQQVLVVTGNPTGEKLNEEIRKALRSLLGKEQSDQVQIRELKSEAELRRIAPGARPIGVQLVQ